MTAELEPLLLARGATMGSYEGCTVAREFGDASAEWKALDEGAGLLDTRFRANLVAEGSERARFLHGQVTNDITGMAAGAGCAAMALTPQGRPIAMLEVYDTGEELWLVVPQRDLEGALEILERFLVADDCEFRPADGIWRFGFAGPKAPSLLREALGDSTEGDSSGGAASDESQEALGPSWGLRRGKIGAIDVTILTRADLRVPSFEVLGEGAGAAQVWERLESLGARPVGSAAYEVLRVESGTALFGQDFDAERLATEPRMEWAIHRSKGCYVGQEVVERSLSRGRLNRVLSLLRSEAPLTPGDAVSDGHKAEVVTSVAVSPRLGDLALAYVAIDQADAGARINFDHDGGLVSAEILPWPRAATSGSL